MEIFNQRLYFVYTFPLYLLPLLVEPIVQLGWGRVEPIVQLGWGRVEPLVLLGWGRVEPIVQLGWGRRS